jgi:DNA-binding HxlR family transcriptional regulator
MLHRLPTQVEGSCKATDCPVEDWLAFLGHRWNAAILWQLSMAPYRFGELAARLTGVTPKVLTERLRTLERRGLVRRNAGQRLSRSAAYALTPAGIELTAIIRLIEPWAEGAAQISEEAGFVAP